ncbi:MAG: flagellar hook-associated protein 3 [Proteobacteria bacterium]|nr:MAG: flagellar hook-associated protein 3 [Pseudomonadota bacterium]
MSLRITNSMLVRTALDGIARQRARLATTQEQASTGLRVNRPSDDPASASRAAQLRAETAANAQYRRNVAQADGRLVALEQSLRTAQGVVVRARELAIQGASGGLDADARRLLAVEVETLFDEMLAAANGRHAGAWIFAGTASDAPAFSRSGPFASGSPPPMVGFDGDSTEIEMAIDEDRRAITSFDGRRVFQGDADGNGAPDAGREDAFAALGELWRALDANDQAAVTATLDRLDRTQLQLELALARVGAIGNQLAGAEDALGLEALSLKRTLSDAEDADTEQVFSNLVAHQTALQASLESAVRAIQPSLFDFLS